MNGRTTLMRCPNQLQNPGCVRQVQFTSVSECNELVSVLDKDYAQNCRQRWADVKA